MKDKDIKIYFTNGMYLSMILSQEVTDKLYDWLHEVVDTTSIVPNKPCFVIEDDITTYVLNKQSITYISIK